MVWTENQYQNHKDRPSQNGGNLPRQTKQIQGTTNHLYHVKYPNKMQQTKPERQTNICDQPTELLTKHTILSTSLYGQWKVCCGDVE